MIWDLLVIAVICVIVIDLTDFVDFIKSVITRILTKGKSSNSDYRLKPFDCSLCSCFWLNIIYLAITSHFTLPYILLALAIAYATPLIKDTILLIETAINTAIQAIMRKLN